MSDITTGYLFVDGEKGVTAQKENDQVNLAVINPSFYSAKPASSTIDPTDQLLELKGTGSYATITGSQLISSISSQVDSKPQIWSSRLRSYNSLGNCSFEVDQRRAGATTANIGNAAFAQDRWAISKSGTYQISAAQTSTTGTDIQVPGTSFYITYKYLRITLTTQQASLGAGDYMYIYQNVEGPMLRELLGDVHSVQLVVRSSVAGLKFSLALQDPAGSRSLLKLCTIPTANTWTLITLPNLPLWAAGGNWGAASGSLGYYFNITLASGTTYTGTADTWQSANVIAATGQDNFAAKAVNSTFDIGFVQHEPGSVCSTLMDLDFHTNLWRCQRYYQKTHNYVIAPGASGAGCLFLVPAGGVNPNNYFPFKQTMAKVPTVTAYNPNSGAINSVRDVTSSADRAVTSTSNVHENGFGGFVVTGGISTIWQAYLNYTADTGW